MTTPPVAVSEPSPVDAASAAYEHTRRHLFPFKFERWLALGLMAFLDQCGRGGISGSIPGGGGPGPKLPSAGQTSGKGDYGLGSFGVWMGEHIALVVALAALAIALLVALIALVLWINSRATFVYIENVATGGTEIARPWRAHAERARSYFAWRFGLALGLMVAVLCLIGLIVASVVTLSGHRLVIALVLLVPWTLLLIVVAALFSVALRDFAAPIQLSAGIGCGAALRVVFGLIRAHPLAFFLYLVLKAVFGIAQGIVLVAAACLTCCCILIPVVTQTFLQPLFYFERAWPLHLLRQMGHDLLTGTVPFARTELAPPQPTGGL